MKGKIIFHCCVVLALIVLFVPVDLKADSAVVLFSGLDTAMSPDSYAEKYDKGLNIGLQLRHQVGQHAWITGEFAHSWFEDKEPQVISAMNLLSTSIIDDVDGGDMSRTRIQGGVTLGSDFDEGINVYGRLLAGLFHLAYDPITYNIKDQDTGEILDREQVRFDGENQFGLTFGGAVEFPASTSVGFFSALDMDVLFRGNQYREDKLWNLTVKVGAVIRF